MVGKKEDLEPTAEVTDDKFARFTIAGANKQWHCAEAAIHGSDVVVTSADVSNPVALRYAYSMNAAEVEKTWQAAREARTFKSLLASSRSTSAFLLE